MNAFELLKNIDIQKQTKYLQKRKEQMWRECKVDAAKAFAEAIMVVYQIEQDILEHYKG
jgi:hypothetical protein